MLFGSQHSSKMSSFVFRRWHLNLKYKHNNVCLINRDEDENKNCREFKCKKIDTMIQKDTMFQNVPRFEHHRKSKKAVHAPQPSNLAHFHWCAQICSPLCFCYDSHCIVSVN